MTSEWECSNVPLGSTLQQSQHPRHTQMNDKCICVQFKSLCMHIWSSAQLCNTPCVSGSLNEVRSRTTLSDIYVIQKYEELSSHACKTNTHAFFFLQGIHKIMMAAHALPQNGCYFASASMWQKAIYILHTLCKLTTTLQQRPIVQPCRSQSDHRTVSSVISCLLTVIASIHTVRIIILQYWTAVRCRIQPVRLSS